MGPISISRRFLISSFALPLRGNAWPAEWGWSLGEGPPKINIMAFLQEWYKKMAGYLDNEEQGFASCGLETPRCLPSTVESTTQGTHKTARPATSHPHG